MASSVQYRKFLELKHFHNFAFLQLLLLNVGIVPAVAVCEPSLNSFVLYFSENVARRHSACCCHM